MATTARRNGEKVNPLWNRVRKFVARFVVTTEAQLDLVTMWIFGTWSFSPGAPAMPYTYPYLYFAGAKESGKTVFMTVLGSLVRNPQQIADITGPAMFRMLGTYDEETGEVTPHYPTQLLDEIDATFNGEKNESLRGPLNIGYKLGSTIPRAVGKSVIQYPAYNPKAMFGIDNGHLPDTVTSRSIRIDMLPATRVQRESLEPFWPWKVDEEAAALRDQISRWMSENGMVLRDYEPEPVDGLGNRQWEIARSLVQLSKAMGNEKSFIKSLKEVMTETAVPTGKVQMFDIIRDLFSDTGEDRVTTRQILVALKDAGMVIRGGSGKGLRNALAEDDIIPQYLRLKEGHPGILTDEGGKSKYVQRGYHLYQFDEAFDKYLADDDDDEII